MVEEDVAVKYLTDVLKKEVHDPDDINEEICKADDQFIEYLPECGIAIGHVIRIDSDDGMVEKKIDDFSSIVKKVEEIGEKLGLGKPKLHTGTYGS